MKASKLVVSAIALAAVAVAPAVGARASGDPLGLYCVVQKVTMAPDEQHPTTAQVWGACALAMGGMTAEYTYSPSWYSEPRSGYLYYTAPKGKEEICQMEWTDLKRAAGTGDVVGFGSRYMSTGRVRWADEKPGGPDVYPIQLGVTRVAPGQWSAGKPFAKYADLFDAIKKEAGVK